MLEFQAVLFNSAAKCETDGCDKSPHGWMYTDCPGEWSITALPGMLVDQRRRRRLCFLCAAAAYHAHNEEEVQPRTPKCQSCGRDEEIDTLSRLYYAHRKNHAVLCLECLLGYLEHMQLISPVKE